MNNDNNKHLYMQEMNAQFILFMYYINYLYYKDYYKICLLNLGPHYPKGKRIGHQQLFHFHEQPIHHFPPL